MLNLRDGLFTAGKTINSAFAGFHYAQQWNGGAGDYSGYGQTQDGSNFSRLVMILKVNTIPAAAETITIGKKTYTFRATVTTTDEIEIGNLIRNGNFASATSGWNLGRHWAIGSSKATHTAGTPITTPGSEDTFAYPLEQMANFIPQIGYAYATSFTITGRSAGSVAIKVGGTTGSTRTTDATYTETLTAVSNEPLQFVPTADFNGAVSAVLVTCTTLPIYGADFLKGLTAKNIADRINLDTVDTLITAYTGLENMGLTTEIVLIANAVGNTYGWSGVSGYSDYSGFYGRPIIIGDGTKVSGLATFDWRLVATKAQLESTDLWKKYTGVGISGYSGEKDVKPVFLTERNPGTYQNFLY